MTGREWRDLRKPLGRRMSVAASVLCLVPMSISGCRQATATGQVLLIRAHAERVEEKGICSVSVGDGTVMLTNRSATPCIVNMNSDPHSSYFYFHVLDDSLKASKAVYAVVRYYDQAEQSHIELQYDMRRDAYRPAVLLSGGEYGGTHRWRAAVFRLDAPAFAGAQNGGADLRLHGKHLCIDALALSSELKRAFVALTPSREPR